MIGENLDESMISHSLQGDDTDLIDAVRLAIAKLTTIQSQENESEAIAEVTSLLQVCDEHFIHFIN